MLTAAIASAGTNDVSLDGSRGDETAEDTLRAN